jgi:hypothetical protein
MTHDIFQLFRKLVLIPNIALLMPIVGSRARRPQGRYWPSVALKHRAVQHRALAKLWRSSGVSSALATGDVGVGASVAQATILSATFTSADKGTLAVDVQTLKVDS